jgi:hypothetical protein
MFCINCSISIRVARDWPPVLNIFCHEQRLKIADSLAFCGDRGAYFIGLLDIELKYKVAFLQVIRALNVFLLKSGPFKDILQASADLVFVFHLFLQPLTVIHVIVCMYIFRIVL